jgi:hypothetical protein
MFNQKQMDAEFARMAANHKRGLSPPAASPAASSKAGKENVEPASKKAEVIVIEDSPMKDTPSNSRPVLNNVTNTKVFAAGGLADR